PGGVRETKRRVQVDLQRQCREPGATFELYSRTDGVAFDDTGPLVRSLSHCSLPSLSCQPRRYGRTSAFNSWNQFRTSTICGSRPGSWTVARAATCSIVAAERFEFARHRWGANRLPAASGLAR